MTLTEFSHVPSTLYIQVFESQGFRSEQFFFYDVRTVRAEAGKLDEARAIEVAQQAVRNIQVNEIHATINDGKFWKKIQGEIDDQSKKVTEERWASIESRHEQFRDVLGGGNRFKASGGEVVLPLSHKYAWEGPNDTFVLSNDCNYRPDSDFNGTWNQLKAKK